jgi:hypothetical protein
MGRGGRSGRTGRAGRLRAFPARISRCTARVRSCGFAPYTDRPRVMFDNACPGLRDPRRYGWVRRVALMPGS